ncbi:hypothetical protein WG66_017075 [Moniliophthora roreri]|nr:hypothetical protein WG66_017075 [Moniliophthora roreri]
MAEMNEIHFKPYVLLNLKIEMVDSIGVQILAVKTVTDDKSDSQRGNENISAARCHSHVEI